MAKQAKIYPKGRFVLRPLQQQPGKTNAVYMYYYWQRKQLRKAMDMFVDEKDWNENAEHGTGGFRASYGPDFQDKNKLLQKMLLDTDKKILEHIQKHGDVTPDVIMSLMNGNGTSLRPDNGIDFVEFAKSYAEKLLSSPSTPTRRPPYIFSCLFRRKSSKGLLM